MTGGQSCALPFLRDCELQGLGCVGASSAGRRAERKKTLQRTGFDRFCGFTVDNEMQRCSFHVRQNLSSDGLHSFGGRGFLCLELK